MQQHRVPTPVPGVDIYKLPLSTLEGFVLSRVDGSASVEDISITCGIDKDKVLTILQRLFELGAVELAWLGPRTKRNSSQKNPASSGAAGAAATPPAPAGEPDAHFKLRAPRFDMAALDEKVGIPVEARRRILHAHYAIENMNLYEALGVRRDADKKVIRTAYFELSKLFHPDAYFGKELGAFKPKMEAVFKRLTEAYETLGKAKKRADYDEYLASTEQTQKLRQTLDSIEITPQDVAAHRVAQAARTPAAVAIRVPRTPAPAKPPSGPIAPSSSRAAMPPPAAPNAERAARQTSLRPQPTTAERRARVRDRLLQRMRSVPSAPPPPISDSTPPPADSGGNRDERRRGLLDGLRSSIHAASVVTSAPNVQIQSFMRKAREAEQAGDVLAAASQLQLALAIEPNNAELVAEYERVSKVVARNLAANYEKQAQYEEKTGNWKAAARSWTRASDGRPEDPHAARRAAEAMIKASADLHRAQTYAQRAVQIDGRNVENLTVLARVYLAAGLKLNALRELEKAAQLAPKDEMVNNLLREVR